MKKSRTDIEAERGYRRVLVSLPEWLWAAIDDAARQNWRKRNAEVHLRLASTFPKNEHGVIVKKVASLKTEPAQGFQP